jgi:hypothetical protein
MTSTHSPEQQDELFWRNVKESARFFVGESDVDRALQKLVQLLTEAQIPYAIAGGMALNAYGYRRVTEDVDVLLTSDGHARFKVLAVGHGYLEKFPGSRGVRDTENNVAIDVLIAGEYPGDGKEKSVVFPDPAAFAHRGARARVLPLSTLIELKLASGMSSLHRLRDLSDVIALIKAARIAVSFAQQLDASVRAKFCELWDAAQVDDDR